MVHTQGTSLRYLLGVTSGNRPHRSGGRSSGEEDVDKWTVSNRTEGRTVFVDGWLSDVLISEDDATKEHASRRVRVQSR